MRSGAGLAGISTGRDEELGICGVRIHWNFKLEAEVV